MQREYQADLLDFWRGSLTPRKLWVLIKGLPGDSHSAYALSDATHDGWSLTDVLLARTIDELAVFRWQVESLFAKKGKRRKPPASVRPSRDTETQAPLISPHQLGGFLNIDDTEGGAG